MRIEMSDVGIGTVTRK